MFTTSKIPVLSVYKYVGFILIVVLVLTVTFTRYSTLTGLPEYTPDLFLPYQAIMPNQPRESLAAYPCPPRPSILSDRAVRTLDSCNVLPRNSAFHLINIIIKYNRIQETSFYSEYLQTNQLMAQWDTPPTIIKTSYQRTLTLQWDRGDYLITAIVPKTLGTSIVRLVTFTRKQS